MRDWKIQGYICFQRVLSERGSRLWWDSCSYHSIYFYKIIAITLAMIWKLYQMDVKTTFLNDIIDTLLLEIRTVLQGYQSPGAGPASPSRVSFPSLGNRVKDLTYVPWSPHWSPRVPETFWQKTGNLGTSGDLVLDFGDFKETSVCEN